MSPDFDPSIDQGEEEIASIREVRHQISERFGHDPYRLVDYLMEASRKSILKDSCRHPGQEP